MPLQIPDAPTTLALFAVDPAGGLPIARMPVYAEVIVRAEAEEPPVEADDRLRDAIQQALRADTPENINSPQPFQRLLNLIGQEIARQLGPDAADLLRDGPAEFIQALIKRVRAAAGNTPLRSLDEAILERALRAAIREEAAGRDLPVLPAPAPAPTVWAYPLGVLATDHAGYLSYDLSRLPPSVLQAVAAAVRARRLDAAAVLDVTIAIQPTGPGGPAFDALAQGRGTAAAIVARIELAKPAIPDAVLNLALPAMQDPSLEDWRLSPGSFATNPGALVGADGCESILPANVALQEFHLYQVVRLTDLTPPVAPVTPGQVKLGVVNEYRVAWNPLGHSLGQILYSLPLAPGESVNLAVIDWTRRDEAQRKERTTVDEQLVHNEHRDRSISEAVTTAVREYQHGSSFMGGIAGAVGGSSGAVTGGVAGSLGGSTSNSSGTRDVSGSTVQKLSDNITQASSAMRELQSTVVVHSTQSEKEAIETRTVVNYNHSHALTILYYEVLRHFRVVTELTRQRPAVLVKLRTDWFDGAAAMQSIPEHRAVLAQSLLDARFADGFDAVDRVTRWGGALADLTKPLPADAPFVPPSRPGFRYFEFEMRTGGFHRAVDDHEQSIDIISTLLGPGGAHVAELVNVDSGRVLNNFGAFSFPDSMNTFTAIAAGGVEVQWDAVTAIALVVAVHPDDGDTMKVSFSHIKVTALDTVSGRPGVVLLDQGYENGHLVVTNNNDENGRRRILPTLRPPPASAPPPTFSAVDVADRERSIALIAHLRAHARSYGRAIAMNQDPFERAGELDAIRFSDASTALEHLENRPLEVLGDYLAYPSTDPVWNALVNARIEPDADRPSPAVLDERLVTLPTRGVFAEAKLGHCNASEPIDNTRFWDWQQSPIPHFAPEIAPTVPVTPQAVQPNMSPTSFPSSIVNIVTPPNAPDPTGLAAAMAVLGTPNLFRDMSGRAEVAEVLKNLADNAVKVAGLTAGRGSGAGAAAGGGTPGSGGGAGAGSLGGPRAMPNQPSASNRDLQDFGNTLGNFQAKGLITPEAAQQAFTDAVRGDASAETVGSTITDVALWLDLIRFVPPAKTLAELKPREIEVQSIFNAMGDLNTDFYAVRITKPPLKGGVAMTAESLLEELRIGINDVVDTGLSEFTPLDPVDAPRWASASPLGAVLRIDIKGPDNAAVVVGEQDNRHWRFCTVETPFWQTGSHPVSGTREFGIRSSSNGLLFYTRGADRATKVLETIFNDAVTFPGADQLWRSLQAKVSAFVNEHGGAAEIVAPYSKRNPWGAVRTLYNLGGPITV